MEETFIDKEGRHIFLSENGCDFFAKHNGKIIGRVETTGLIETDRHCPVEPAVITGMFVDSDYQRAGIGLALLKVASNELGTLAPGKRNIGIGNQNALTEAGEHITRYAQKLGLVLPFPDEGPE